MRRFCVFSHDELVCKMATMAENLTLQVKIWSDVIICVLSKLPLILSSQVAAVAYNDMLQLVEEEKQFTRNLLEGGVRDAEREAFELLPEEVTNDDYEYGTDIITLF